MHKTASPFSEISKLLQRKVRRYSPSFGLEPQTPPLTDAGVQIWGQEGSNKMVQMKKKKERKTGMGQRGPRMENEEANSSRVGGTAGRGNPPPTHTPRQTASRISILFTSLLYFFF